MHINVLIQVLNGIREKFYVFLVLENMGPLKLINFNRRDF
jgi:hypothetical protein